MAKTFAATGAKSHVSISIDGGSTFTEVLGVENFSFSGKQKNTEDKTTLLSPNGYVERNVTTRDAGKFTLNVFFNPQDPGQTLLASSFDVTPDQELTVKVAYDAANWGFTTTGPVKTFSAWVVEYPDPGADFKANTKQAISLQINGPITTTAGA